MSKPIKQKTPRFVDSQGKLSTGIGSNEIMDPRFANIQKSALYRLPTKRQTHIPLDSRFAHMLSDERFQSRSKVDRYGRKTKVKKGQNELERLYLAKAPISKEQEHSEEASSEDIADEDELVRRELEHAKKNYDPARDGGFSESSSDEDIPDEDDQDDTNVDEIQYLENAEDDIPEGQISTRIAVVNLDWDNIRAIDLMAVFSSFAPADGRILKVAVYPSSFGRERLEKEETEGPPKEIFTNSQVASTNAPDVSDEDDDSAFEDERIKKSMLREDTGEEFDSASLRRYQLERLRYFYAVLTCSSSACAEKIYNSVDGTEYLSSANFFDLRFIPDNMDFSGDTPRDECDCVPGKYRPNEFVTDALQHSKVKLTWDADDVVRKEVQRKAFSGSRADIDGE